MSTPVGIIGLGRLGASLARGLARAGVGAGLCGHNRSAAKAAAVARQAPGLELASSARDVLERCDPVFVWMARADACAVLEAHREVLAAHRPLLVSCTPGVPLAGFTPRWAESLPNVALSTGRGVTLLACAPDLPAPDRARLVALLGACGAVHEVPQPELGHYSALCSSGPGLYARLMERWADALSTRRGYDRALCRAMVREAMEGTLALHAEDGIDADALIHRVAHPGGSTEQGLAVIDRRFPALAEELLQAMKKG